MFLFHKENLSLIFLEPHVVFKLLHILSVSNLQNCYLCLNRGWLDCWLIHSDKLTKLVHHWVERAWNIHSANHQRAAAKWGSYTISWYKPVRLHSPNTSWPFHICFNWVLETSIYDKRILQRNVPSDTWNVCPVCTQKWTFAKLSTIHIDPTMKFFHDWLWAILCQNFCHQFLI